MSDLVEKFWARVDKSGSCWLWLGAKRPDGYGEMFIRKMKGKSDRVRAHRFSFELAFGKIPDGLYICHKCDNPSCVRPDHLFAGTQKENIADMWRKGRQNAWDKKGERNGSAKLTTENAKTVRHLYFAERRTLSEIGKFFGVANQTIWSVVHQLTWAGNR